LAEKLMTLMPQPQYSPYLAPSGCWLFPRPKIELRCQRLAAVDIRRSATGLRATPLEIFPEYYHSLQIHWEQVCVCVCVYLSAWCTGNNAM